ncbi:OmpA family protein [Mangrovimonas sp. YM274]|uniref:OmpA family protein n=1 Tax=Mangrovimonas sp. YM274 TaxID=3070660 RepID=UPI0027DAEEF4|nr:OmpA family protein [Mangrovimonas sp. YM274]WMI67349.1 OmpA family protein [Mangrovimonas sp. YM274]
MKNIVLLISLLFTVFFGYGQKASASKAKKLFENRAYSEAAKMYQSLPKTPENLQNLGDSYFYNAQMTNAKAAYAQLFASSDSLPKVYYFRYGQSLKAAGDFKTADSILSIYTGEVMDTPKLKRTLSRIVPYLYELQPLKNSASGDFGISWYGDNVVFSSYRNKDNPTYEWNNKPYLDLYEATLSEEKDALEQVTPFSEDINSKTHESNATFTADGKTMYFSRTNDKRVKIGDDKIATIKLYKAELIDGKWTNVEELPFSSDTYSTQHPFLNPSNTKLFFSSDMPGSLGSFDIYSVDITEDGFGTPVNLGEVINTEHREQFPFMDQSETLYFASDGHQGLGNLDIFMSNGYAGFYSKPINLGETINSGMDDFGYVLNEDVQKGFISSNRSGEDLIYAFLRIPNKKRYIVEGTVIDKNTKEILPGTTVTLYDDKGEVVGQTVVGDDAKYAFNTKPNQLYRIEGYRDFYAPGEQEFTTNDDGRFEFNIELEIESYDDAEDIVVTKDDGYIYIELENIYFDFGKWDIKPQAASILDIMVGLLKKYPRMEVQLGAHTDSRSSEEYNLNLSLNRAKSTLEYLVANGIERSRLRSKGYGESQPLVDCKDDCTEEEHSINRRCEFLILK